MSSPTVQGPEQQPVYQAPAPVSEYMVTENGVVLSDGTAEIVYTMSRDDVTGVITFTPKQGQYGGKRSRSSKKSKKGGDATGVLTAGTLLLLQAAARKALKKQKGGQVIASAPAPVTIETSIVGGSMCGVPQEGGKKVRKGKKQSGGMAELNEAFNTMLKEVEQKGGKKKSGSKKQKGGMADLKEAFEAIQSKPEPVVPVGGEMSIKQEGGKKKSAKKQKGGNALDMLQSIQQSFASLKA